MSQSAATLVPVEGVERRGADLVARLEQPWLRIVDAARALSGQWIRIRYRSSFFDDPVRPLLRCQRQDQEMAFQALNGPVLGAAEAIVRLPDDTVSVSISPAARTGRFDFVVDTIAPVSAAVLLADGLRRQPAWALVAAGARLIGARQEARQDLKFATGSTPLESYDAWHRSLARPLDLHGIDRPRSDWRNGPTFRLIMGLAGSNADRLDTTLRSLRGQAYSRWTLCALIGPQSDADMVARYRAAVRDDARLCEISAATTIEDLACSPDDRIAVIEAGDIMPDYALATVAEAIARDPGAAVIYGDEDAVAADGSLHSPMFKPDFSPALQAAAPYMGRLCCMRCADLARSAWAKPQELVATENDALNGVLKLVEHQNVVHLRRILYRRRRKPSEPSPPLGAAPAVRNFASIADWPSVTVVIPTRDQAGHLRQCMKGLKETTDYPRFDTVIVDNGSRAGAAVALLDQIESGHQGKVIRAPGPFNYSALCNLGVAQTSADVVVMLNNDIVMIEAGWLKALIAFVMREDVGAVGAKLLYPNGTIQHAGIVVGSGGRAGHLYKGARSDEPGYLRELQVAREVAAVTGACLAVQRAKFQAIGGFDEVKLPIDLSDVDLCLRLAERGWRTIWTPDAILYHVEGGSRRRISHPAKVYAAERRYFVERWAHVIRDDPYFHPALSLYSHRPALARS